MVLPARLLEEKTSNAKLSNIKSSYPAPTSRSGISQFCAKSGIGYLVVPRCPGNDIMILPRLLVVEHVWTWDRISSDPINLSAYFNIFQHLPSLNPEFFGTLSEPWNSGWPIRPGRSLYPGWTLPVQRWRWTPAITCVTMRARSHQMWQYWPVSRGMPGGDVGPGPGRSW